MKQVTIVAPMESNGRYPGGIMTVANTLYAHRDKLLQRGIELNKFNTYILQRKAESIGKLDFTNVRNMFCILGGLLKVTGAADCDALYYNSSTKAALLKDLLIIRLLRLFGRRQRITLHIHFAELEKILPGQKQIRRWMLKAMNKWTDQIIFLSDETRKEFEQAGLEPGKGTVIYNFYSSAISAERLEQKLRSVTEKKKVDFLFMGSIDSRKGILDLMHAFEQMDPEKACLHICGSCNDDSVREEFNELLNRLEDRVIFHGFVTGEEREQILDQTDCMVLPSYGEGFPLVIIDAMAHGSACITTPVGAVPEFFTERKNGWLFQAGNVQQLVQALEEAEGSRKLLTEQMRTNYAQSDSFSLDCFMDKLQKVL